MQTNGKSPKQVAFDVLARGILTMQNAPGSDLDEAALSASFGLSRTPMREVLRQLAGEGYAEIRENRGARVAQMSQKTLRDFFLAAPMIYSAINRLAAENATAGRLTALKDVQQTMRKAVQIGTAADRAYANNQFHLMIGSMAGNIYLLPSLNRLLIDHARISMTFYQPRSPKMAENLAIALDQHDAMIASFETGDAEGAAQLAADHWSLSRHQIELFVMPDALTEPLGDGEESRIA